ncbi:indole-3-glycerol phosphate synthase TrpC [Bacillus subtilis]|uniref:indole-3-glycerol phosphate synthase TrpC n=1 Tax=Bacillus TaxID=1386 RepID=UPI000FFDFCBE|nr:MULTISPECIES: indole-3-glycerol phosphate synthase TrpC [Bacillus]MEC2401086.1 indole-3-glycerol phosphate synthase TrpC [Bacillus subtilis]MED4663510.1 indole-3-glycerol phosphate synthase TrpC [Bacillus subtilis]MED4666111.1 indole-3-glycerol phosphate synthase TrpC [Bacillus subtilis]NJJ24667.1 indole-3-glycerol phosphate synthase TrpC [Bacillus subtilis]QAT56564.1 indole-3-glycerol phosphate synthase TrpC [Bacillus subtilis]
MNMLDEIIEYKYSEVKEKKKCKPESELINMIQTARKTRDFYQAIQKPNISLIAEVKRKSPSKGLIRKDFDPLKLARTYDKSGASAISVLIDEKFFGGSAKYLRKVANDPDITIPVMYKEFIVDPYQIYEARANGADAVLIIVRAIDQTLLSELIQLAYDLDMDVLTETFTPEEVTKSIEAGAKIIGINNRDLQTFEVDLEKSKVMKKRIPDEYLAVSESGILTRQDVLAAQELGFDGMLVGETILRADSVEEKVKELTNF